VDNGSEIWVHGTHLVTFARRAVIIGTLYVNQNGIQNRVPGVPKLPLLNITSHQRVLSLPYLRRLNEGNLETIRRFREEFDAERPQRVALTVAASCCLLLCVAIVGWRAWKAKRSARQLNVAIAELRSAEGGLRLEGGVVNQS